MSSNPPPNADVPVYVGPLTFSSGDRSVQVCRADGTLSQYRPCASHREFVKFVEHERSDADVDDPAQVYWADHPGVWPSPPQPESS